MGMSLALSSVRLDPLYNNIANLFGGAKFAAPLTSSAVPTSAATGTTATFTRATASTWKNNDGYLVTGVAGEIGFVGARRVRNLLTFTQAFGSWTVGGTGSVVSDSTTAPDGTVTADTLVAGTAGNGDRVTQDFVTPSSTLVYSIYAKANTNSGVTIKFYNNTTATALYTAGLNLSTLAMTDIFGTGTSSVEAVGNGWYRFSIKTSTSIVAGNSIKAYVYPDNANGTGAAGSIYIWGAQIEDVTARTDQTTPSEYVSVGVASAPYFHGSFVDGVRCYSTALNGSPIPSSTLLGYSAEGARTNLCLQSNAFTTTWTNSGAAPTQNVVGIDGATSAWTLTDSSAVATAYITQAITLTAAAYTFSVFVKKTSGATTFPVWFTLTGTTMASITIDTNNGVATVWSAYTGYSMAGGISATCTSYNSNYWRVTKTFTGTAAAWNTYLQPAATSNATQSTGTTDVTVQGSAVFTNVQVELGSSASSYIATTTIAVTRNANVLTYSGGDIANLKTLSASFRREVGVSEDSLVVGVNDGTLNNRWHIGINTATSVNSFGRSGGGDQWNISNSVYTPGTIAKLAASVATNDIKTAFNGGYLGIDITATIPVVTTLGVGTTVGVGQPYATIRGLYGWTRNFSQSELNAVTS